MIEYLLMAFLLAIWHSILFFNNKLGLSVILFIIPVLGFIIYVLKMEKRIVNKKGLLLLIPIILLSCTYFVYDNYFFKMFNLIIIPLLFFIMYVVAIKNEYNFFGLIKDSLSFITKPFTYFDKIFRVIYSNLFKNIKISDKVKSKIKSFIIILPIILVVLWLLTSADIIFESIFSGLFDGINCFFSNFISENLIWRLLLILIVFIAISGTIYYLVYDYLKDYKLESEKDVKDKIFNNSESIKMLFISLNIIYVIFDFIQIKSLILHLVSKGINYAEYARSGFFQLMVVSVINLVLILILKKYIVNENKKNSKFLKIMGIIMVVLTFIIIISSFLRMNLYEQEYGYTLLRLLVYFSLITETILLIPTIIYIVKYKYNIMVSYMIIIVFVYILINYINVDKMIAVRNINRYYDKNDIDLVYLLNDGTDNLEVLIEFYKDIDDKEIKDELNYYFKDFYIEDGNIVEYNISRDRGRKLLYRYK